MKEKNFQYFLDEAAQEFEYDDYAHYMKSPFNSSHDDWDFNMDLIKSAAERHANHVKAIALQEVFEKGCEAQKAVCAEHAKAIEDWHRGRFMGAYVSKDSILNAPNAANPYTK